MNSFYKAKHILIEEEDDLSYIMDELNQGRPFEELAKEYSECESAAKGGDLGRFPSGSMDAEFERALYHMQVGEVKSGVKTKFGYHIIWRLA